MAEILLLCSGCSQVVIADAQCAGKVVTCPTCNKQTRASSLVISFSCPACNHELVTTKELSGSSCNCPQCEHELCVPTVSQYKAHNNSDTPNRVKAANTNTRTYLHLAGLACISVIIWAVWHNVSSRKVPSQTQEVIASQTSSTNAIKLDFFGSHSEGECFVIFPSYVKAIRDGNFEGADALLAEIKSKLTSPKETADFWNKVIPSDKTGQLLLCSLCDNCKSGHCPKCGGNDICLECKGGKICPVCKGIAPVEKRCDKCYCNQCRGSGLCSTCKGKMKTNCPRCSGQGEVSISTSKACQRCDGRGQRSGLMLGDGSSMPVQCLTCKGKGSVATAEMKACSSCNRNGRMQCRACYGRGQCSNCNGIGRQRYCNKCNNTGKLVLQCKKCAGTGQCEVCQGSGSCVACAHTGLCKDCQGRGLLKQYEFIVDTSWLQHDTGYIAFDAFNNKSLAENGDSGSSTIRLPEHTIKMSVSSNQCIGISTSKSFDWCRNQILKVGNK
jgi:hypothetical protein